MSDIDTYTTIVLRTGDRDCKFSLGAQVNGCPVVVLAAGDLSKTGDKQEAEIAALKQRVEESKKIIEAYRAAWLDLDKLGMDEASLIIGKHHFKGIKPLGSN